MQQQNMINQQKMANMSEAERVRFIQQQNMINQQNMMAGMSE